MKLDPVMDDAARSSRCFSSAAIAAVAHCACVCYSGGRRMAC